MSKKKNFSKVLNLSYEKQEDKSIRFEDGIEYSDSELYSMKLINSNLKNNSTKEMYVEKIHMMKKYGYEVGIVLKNS